MRKSSKTYKWLENTQNLYCKNCNAPLKVSSWSPQRLYYYASLNKVPQFCSHRCHGKYSFSKGKNHPAYKNGTGRGYNWRFRKEAIKILKPFCSRCGKTTGRLDLHHKDENPKHNILENVQILCASCHRKIHAKALRKYPSYIYKNSKTYNRYIQKQSAEKIKNKRKELLKIEFNRYFGHSNFVRARDIAKKFNITRERVRQLKNANRLKYIKVDGIYLYEMPQKNKKRSHY